MMDTFIKGLYKKDCSFKAIVSPDELIGQIWKLLIVFNELRPTDGRDSQRMDGQESLSASVLPVPHPPTPGTQQGGGGGGTPSKNVNKMWVAQKLQVLTDEVEKQSARCHESK